MQTTSRPTATVAIGSFLSSLTVLRPRRTSPGKSAVFAVVDRVVTGYDLVTAFLRRYPDYLPDRTALLSRYTRGLRLNVNSKLWDSAVTG